MAGDQRLAQRLGLGRVVRARDAAGGDGAVQRLDARLVEQRQRLAGGGADEDVEQLAIHGVTVWRGSRDLSGGRSEEHTSELQSLMRISYAVFCLKKKRQKITKNNSCHITEIELTV